MAGAVIGAGSASGSRRRSRSARRIRAGLTLIELILGASFLVIAMTGLLQAFMSQTSLNEYSRCLSWTVADAERVMERIRLQNTGGGCATPSLAAPAGFASWDAWLASIAANGGGGKSIQPNPAVNELIVLSASGSDPIRVSVAVCWRNRNRTLGECTWNGMALAANPAAGGDPTVTESPAMLSTLVGCR